MQLDALRNLLNRYPSVKQAAKQLISIFPLTTRLGKNFWTWYAFFEESEGWTEEQLLEYQLDRLRVLLQELSTTSEFYRQRLSGVDIQKIESIEQFKSKVPTLTRKDFRKHFSTILSSESHRLWIREFQTSGTTGTPLQFHHLTQDWAREWAAVCHQWKRVGYIPGKSRRAEFRNRTSQGQLVEGFPDRNMIRCSIADLKGNARFFADELRKHEIDILHGYPSALHLLANEIRRSGVNFPQPKAIMLVSENIYDIQLTRIQEVFPNSKLHASYGCSERTAIAGWCEYRRDYHVLPQYALVEFDEITNEIIGTNLFNSVNGFLRYRMSDTILEIENTICPDCGRPYTPRIVKLGGRSMDYLYSPQKGWLPSALLTVPFKPLKWILETRLVQEEKATLIIEYIPHENADEAAIEMETDQLQDDLSEIFGKDMHFIFTQVDDFPRGPTGKFKWINCELIEMPGESLV